ncbi:MAG TPA: bifunctional diguanylate cyclase/phosphodiesterase [Terriglobia bacterium]|jgi:diguanylate cyclase (GGDEF)-like protein
MPRDLEPKEPGKRTPQPVRTPTHNPQDEPGTEPLVSSPWTRSPGRVRFRGCLEHAIERGKKESDFVFAVLYVDLDRFTLLNESLGRKTADDLLVKVARRLRAGVRARDIVTRLREDEYVIYLDDIPEPARAIGVVESLRDALRPVFSLEGHNVFVSASVGIAIGPGGYSKAEEIVRDAEAAMHHAKKQGPGSYEVFNAQLHEGAKKLLTLETELRGAIESGQLRLHFEPIVFLETGRVAGFEALLRWQHPERGMVPPGEFVPMAEKTGLIVPITRWVLQEGCRQLKQWQSAVSDFSSLWLSMNLSPSYIEKCDFAAELSAYVAESGVDASNLVMEITESQLLENADSILKGFTALHERGIKMWIDDFGSGYSSLAYLVKFPIHSLKIDRSFIEKLNCDDKSTAIAKAIVSLGKSLGVNVIAEGVETKQQLDYLRSVGCPYAQGHLFSMSIDAETVQAILTRKQIQSP